MGILQTSLPRKNDLSLDKLLLGFILGEKIHLHWNKCQGMAREFILFAHICHWMGGKTAVPFKTSPSCLTECHRGKMKTPGEWGQAWSPQGWINRAILLFFLGSWQASPSSECCGWRRTLQNGCLFFTDSQYCYEFLSILWIIYSLTWKGNRRWEQWW